MIRTRQGRSRKAQPTTPQLELSFTKAAPVQPSTKGERAKGHRPRDRPQARRATADSLARQQREISISEFFAKNRHLLGFDNRRKALLTTVKEAVDNSLDACEEAGILPNLHVEVTAVQEGRFRVTVQDNGPGIVKQQIPNIFGKLLYGSKFHRLKMSRGQQGIGISAAGMYGLITTGKPVNIISRTGSRARAHCYRLAIDTKKNRPEIIHDDTVDVDWPHGTRVEIELEGNYGRGRQSVDEYMEQTAIANPHARIEYLPPTNKPTTYARGSSALPPETREIRPHPYGIELGTLMKMLKDTDAQRLGAFLHREFSRVSAAMARQVCTTAGLSGRTWVKSIAPEAAEQLYNALQNTRIRAPATDCLAPIGTEQILAGLLQGIRAEFYTASTRSPSVYRGNPFQVEVGLAFGGDLPADELAKVIRFANRVPLLYQQSHCAIYRAVVDTNWRAYGLQQGRGALPAGPLVVMVHFASVWVPFTSESKEAIADYDEIQKEITLALRDSGRKLATYLKRRHRTRKEGERRGVFQRYIGEVVQAIGNTIDVNKERLHRDLQAIARRRTAQADRKFDDHGRPIKKKTSDALKLEDTVIVEHQSAPAADQDDLFEDHEHAVIGGPPVAKGRARTSRNRNGKRVRRRAS